MIRSIWPFDKAATAMAIAVISGLISSTALTLVVIPVVYYGVMRKRVEWIRTATG